MNFQSKTIVITGASGGIGAPLATLLANAGAHIVTLGRSRPALTYADHITVDLSKLEGAMKAAEALKQLSPDLLINMAGVQYFGKFDMQPVESIASMYQLNLVTPALLCQAVIPDMKRRGSGHIVNVGSIFGSIAFAHFVTYCSTKAGLKHLSEGLRRELNDTGVNVTYVAPRAVKTPLQTGPMLEFGEKTSMTLDDPETIAKRVLTAIARKEKNVFIGFPETFFVRINALLPGAVDGALSKNNKIAEEILAKH